MDDLHLFEVEDLASSLALVDAALLDRPGLGLGFYVEVENTTDTIQCQLSATLDVFDAAGDLVFTDHPWVRGTVRSADDLNVACIKPRQTGWLFAKTRGEPIVESDIDLVSVLLEADPTPSEPSLGLLVIPEQELAFTEVSEGPAPAHLEFVVGVENTGERLGESVTARTVFFNGAEVRLFDPEGHLVDHGYCEGPRGDNGLRETVVSQRELLLVECSTGQANEPATLEVTLLPWTRSRN